MRKHILIFGHNYASQFVDIFNQYTLLFDKTKYKVTVLYLTGKPDQAVRDRTLAEEVIFLNVSKQSISMLKINAVRKLLALCREEKFQMVICHRYKPSYIMLWVAQFCRIPALFFVMHELKTMSSIARRLLIAMLQRKNMIFAGVSNAVRDDIRRDVWFIPKERIITLYNMIDVDLTQPMLYSKTEARQALNLPEDAFLFGNVARLVPNKSIDVLIHAFSQIHSECPRAKLILIGAGALEQTLKAQVAALQITDKVIFTGYVTKAFRYMPALDCFVLSSKQEAFGRVLLEAMIAKLPLIATRTNGIPEVIGHAGSIIPPNNASALAAAMKEMYSSSEEQQLENGNKAYQRALDYFSIPCFQHTFWGLPLTQSLKE